MTTAEKSSEVTTCDFCRCCFSSSSTQNGFSPMTYLPCFHAMCSRCKAQRVRSSSDKVSCVVCNLQCSSLDLFDYVETDPRKIYCFNCNNNAKCRPIVQWCCQTCGGRYLCADCAQPHVQTAHTLNPVKPDVPARSQCVVHPGYIATYFCSCQMKMCDTCAEKHKHLQNHHCNSFADLAQMARQRLIILKEKSHSDIAIIEKLFPIITRNRKLVQESCAKVRSSIADEVVELCNALMRRGNDIVAYIDTIENTHMKHYATCESELKIQFEKLRKVERFADSSVSFMTQFQDHPGISSANQFAHSAYKNICEKRTSEVQHSIEISQRSPHIRYISDLVPVVNSIRSLGQIDVDGDRRTPITPQNARMFTVLNNPPTRSQPLPTNQPISQQFVQSHSAQQQINSQQNKSLQNVRLQPLFPDVHHFTANTALQNSTQRAKTIQQQHSQDLPKAPTPVVLAPSNIQPVPIQQHYQGQINHSDRGEFSQSNILRNDKSQPQQQQSPLRSAVRAQCAAADSTVILPGSGSSPNLPNKLHDADEIATNGPDSKRAKQSDDFVEVAHNCTQLHGASPSISTTTVEEETNTTQQKNKASNENTVFINNSFENDKDDNNDKPNNQRNSTERNENSNQTLNEEEEKSDKSLGEWDDYCYVCGNGCDDKSGQLGCCDKCPRVFHNRCHVPRIEIPMEDTPDDWKCTMCSKTPPLETQTSVFNEREKILCSKVILSCFIDNSMTEPFLTEVPKSESSYYALIKKPTSFNTISKRVSSTEYVSIEGFMEDMNQLFMNCSIFNPPESSVARAGMKIWELYKGGIKRFLPGYETKVWIYISLHNQSDRPRRRNRLGKSITPTPT